MQRGYDKPLYILPFDHRATFTKNLFGWEEPLSPEKIEKIAQAKRVIFDGFRLAVAEGVPKDRAGILVDEEFGAGILKDAAREGYLTACPAEQSGHDEFDFEYGDDFARHIEAINPTFCKVLVRYNPGSDTGLNQRQINRLKTLSEYLHSTNRWFMFELLVPATPEQLRKTDNNSKKYDLQLRPQLMVQAIEELQKGGVEPDVWKIEGLDKQEDCQKIVAVARREGRSRVGCIVLGRGENDQHVADWLRIAASVNGFIGFAVGRTTFWDPLKNFLNNQIQRTQAVEQIGNAYKGWVDLFETAR
ncbi:DUF2090 domain-containing protein [Telmatocola sphagniphila]|uniref:DUF2090 domain-containing protein n=1 Tax=Telmatocola sphagniphila TaxID=1123043 RepID=A0A8E6B523_9BACT|nr:DUF2090 domain-containing protein [Telmatocola sphagniphila]QVL30648.1 DUF2090 domain-containing protein [Telmatocola sphagniphila]